MGHLGVVLYEYLGEEYPEVLGSILGALKAIVNVIGECWSKYLLLHLRPNSHFFTTFVCSDALTFLQPKILKK